MGDTIVVKASSDCGNEAKKARLTKFAQDKWETSGFVPNAALKSIECPEKKIIKVLASFFLFFFSSEHVTD